MGMQTDTARLGNCWHQREGLEVEMEIRAPKKSDGGWSWSAATGIKSIWDIIRGFLRNCRTPWNWPRAGGAQLSEQNTKSETSGKLISRIGFWCQSGVKDGGNEQGSQSRTNTSGPWECSVRKQDTR